MTNPDVQAVFESALGVSSQHRPALIVDWAYSLGEDDGPLFWAVVQKVWPTFDLICHSEFRELFVRFNKTTPPPPDLPNKFTAYRGQKNGDEPDGLSWTLNRNVAVRFSRGTRGETAPMPIVFERAITPNEVAFYCNDRDEEEVVLFEIPY